VLLLLCWHGKLQDSLQPVSSSTGQLDPLLCRRAGLPPPNKKLWYPDVLQSSCSGSPCCVPACGIAVAVS
jgi:hypothetical protein